jgi:exosome complex RNA-binding protein Csl4
MAAVPGKILGTEEEFIAGANTVQVGSDILAAVAGKEMEKDKVVSVKQAPIVPTYLRPGDFVVGRIEEIFEPVALIGLGYATDEKGRTRQISTPGYAVLHASRVKDGYVKNIHDEVKIGDIVRARVDELKKEDVALTIRERNLGVIIAFCTSCRVPMKRNGGVFNCAKCGASERRKFAEE